MRPLVWGAVFAATTLFWIGVLSLTLAAFAGAP
jgi:hypothetical protein